MVELARHFDSQRPVTSTSIAEVQHIPEKYLVHILLQLKRAGLVRSVRGAQGGYLLGHPAKDITLLSIVQCIDGPVLDPASKDNGISRDLRPAWDQIAAGIENVLQQMTLDEMLEMASQSNMYYI